MTWKGATDGGGATNQFCSVGNADLRQREARAGHPDCLPLEAQPACDGHVVVAMAPSASMQSQPTVATELATGNVRVKA